MRFCSDNSGIHTVQSLILSGDVWRILVCWAAALNCCFTGAPDKPCGVGRADANPKTVLPNDT